MMAEEFYMSGVKFFGGIYESGMRMSEYLRKKGYAYSKRRYDLCNRGKGRQISKRSIRTNKNQI